MEEGKAKLMTLADVNAFVNAYDAESEKKRRLLGIGCTYRVAVPSVALLTEIARVTDSRVQPTGSEGYMSVRYRGLTFYYKSRRDAA
ncbi:MAG: hypothetical protein HFJ65_03290 [Eggerthellaceae bacterium]|nr:hypothetical protein [Eggerthellaceae bacterium]